VHEVYHADTSTFFTFFYVFSKSNYVFCRVSYVFSNYDPPCNSVSVTAHAVCLSVSVGVGLLIAVTVGLLLGVILGVILLGFVISCHKRYTQNRLIVESLWGKLVTRHRT